MTWNRGPVFSDTSGGFKTRVCNCRSCSYGAEASLTEGRSEKERSRCASVLGYAPAHGRASRFPNHAAGNEGSKTGRSGARKVGHPKV
jgi:hypothetical protein